MTFRRRLYPLLAFLLIAAAAPVSGQVHFGPQASAGSDSGVGLGGRLVFPLRTGLLGIDGAIDGNYFFGGGSAVDSWFDANFNIRVPVPVARDFTTRIGAGLNAAFISRAQVEPGSTSTDTELGLNLLASVGLPRNWLAPFVELRAVVGGAEQAVLTAGFTLGPRR
jgi:hypothetical protein